jgi:NAD(P)-dependent dehydrogenase (short-subunit alcohol dehydrogenase family)
MTQNLSLAGRHAFVTGGSRGIGLAIVHALLQQGVHVTVASRSADSLRQAALSSACDNLHTTQLDVTQEDQVALAFERAQARFGAVDILVNNAGQAISQRFDRTSLHDWRQMLAVNLDGTFLCTQQALPAMVARGWGRVVNVASTAGLTGYAYVAAYCAAKHAVVGFTRALALEVARKGVTVNAICPGYTDTDIVAHAVSNIVEKTGMTAEQARARLAERNPQGRLVQPDQVAAAVLWLCQEQSGAINGQAVPVDGGEVMAG